MDQRLLFSDIINIYLYCKIFIIRVMFGHKFIGAMNFKSLVICLTIMFEFKTQSTLNLVYHSSFCSRSSFKYMVC